MVKYLIARELSGRNVITNDGASFGRVVDVDINEITGKIESLVIEPDGNNQTADSLKGDDGYSMVPYESVLAVSDYVIIDRNNLRTRL